MGSQAISEHEIQSQILDYLKFKRIFHWRNNIGGSSGSHKGKRWFVRFGMVGSPDIFAIRDGQSFGIEVKARKGKLSDEQIIFSVDFERAGGIYIVARSLEDVTGVLS